MKVTIKQIAAEAQVSAMTVSNVINQNTDKVSQKTREKVEQIIAKYDYSPNMNARALVAGSSKLIGLLFYTEQTHFDFTDPFVGELLAGIEKITKEHHFFTLVHQVSTAADVAELQKNWNFDGFIAIGVASDFYVELKQTVQVPIVYIDTYRKERLESELAEVFIHSDDAQSGALAYDHLVSQGQQKIAFLAYEFAAEKPTVISERYRGIKRQQEHHGLPAVKIFKNTDFSELLTQLAEYEGIIVSSDYLGIQFLEYLKEKHLAKTDYPALIGFDDIPFAAYYTPSLSTIRLDQQEKGQQATTALLALIETKEATPDVSQQKLSLPGQLIVRQSTQPIEEER